MGRYYNGDIEGKMWFAVQSSNDADFFGVEGYQPERLKYYFEKKNLPKIKEGIEKCKNKLGKFKNGLDLFFKKKDGYTEKQIAEYFKIPEISVKPILEWYARIELGEEIYNYLKKNDFCEFEVEL
jgi:hypothetical protein